MAKNTRYDSGMKWLVVAAVALLGGLLAPAGLMAQVRGLPPTATSLGPGGQVVAPLPPTATSVGPAPLGPSTVGQGGLVFDNVGIGGGFGIGGLRFGTGAGFGRHHHHRNGGTFIGGAYPVYVPVPVATLPYSEDYAADENYDAEDRPAPTVFERGYRGRVERYPQAAADDDAVAAPARNSDETRSEQLGNNASSEAKPVSAQPASVLVFRDGRKLQVQNYAIVGDTLYDFTPGHQRKVALSELDLKATTSANEEQGVDFQVPGKSE
jgi:hypothetical protein